MAKELVGSASNVYALPSKAGAWRPMVEVILLVSEPRYEVDAGADFVKRRGVEDVRIHTGPEGLRLLAKKFESLADEAEALVDRGRPKEG